MDYLPMLRKDKFPHIWCEGCGDGIALKAIIRAIINLGLEQNKIGMVSGIGCSSRTPGYADFNTLHTTHGRAIPSATGLKMARPELTTIVVTGDGDATAIGGNHLIHAARRNINLTVLLYNNYIYGMTGGQVSPTTPMGDIATTAPYGGLENTFDIAGLTIAAGASFVARCTVYHAKLLEKLIERAIAKKGFSLVEILSPCPTAYGKLNKKGDAPAMMRNMKENVIPIKAFEKLNEEQQKNKITRGIFREIDKPEYCDKYNDLIESLNKEKGE